MSSTRGIDGGAATAYGTVRLVVCECKRDALDKLIAAHAVSWI